jgi:hypothetical protein
VEKTQLHPERLQAHPYSAKVKNEWICNSIPPQSFMAYTEKNLPFLTLPEICSNTALQYRNLTHAKILLFTVSSSEAYSNSALSSEFQLNITIACRRKKCEMQKNPFPCGN